MKRLKDLVLDPWLVACYCFGLATFLSSCTSIANTGQLPPETRRQGGKPQIEESALVQVLIYGLAIFDFRTGMAPDMKSARVIFPFAPGHRVQVARGEEFAEGKYDWYTVAGDEESGIKINNTNISFDDAPEGKLNAIADSGELEGLPKNNEVARDIRWIMPVSALDSHRNLIPGSVQATLTLDSGTVETCGLVHPPVVFEAVCSIKSDYSDRIRAASEYVVYRFTVPKELHTIGIVFERAGQQQRVAVTAAISNNEELEIGGKIYPKIFEVVVRNMMDSGDRLMETDHAKYFKPLFLDSSGSWNMKAPDCKKVNGRLECDLDKCISGRQPLCLLDFVKRYESWFVPAAGNRPMCPFVEYP